jgi:hypothetical protein
MIIQKIWKFCVFALIILTIGCTGESAKEQYEQTLNHCLAQSKLGSGDACTVRSTIHERRQEDGGFATYAAEDIVGRPFLVRSRIKLDSDKDYVLTGSTLSDQKSFQGKVCFQVVDAAPPGLPTWTPYAVGIAILGALGGALIYYRANLVKWIDGREARKIVRLGRKAGMLQEAQDSVRGFVRTVFRGDFVQGPVVASESSLVMQPISKLGAKTAAVIYQKDSSSRIRQPEGRFTVLLVSRRGTEPKFQVFENGLQVHRHFEIDSTPETDVISRKGSFVVMHDEMGETYVLACPDRKVAPMMTSASGSREIVSDINPVRIEPGDSISVGDVRFTFHGKPR